MYLLRRKRRLKSISIQTESCQNNGTEGKQSTIMDHRNNYYFPCCTHQTGQVEQVQMATEVKLKLYFYLIKFQKSLSQSKQTSNNISIHTPKQYIRKQSTLAHNTPLLGQQITGNFIWSPFKWLPLKQHNRINRWIQFPMESREGQSNNEKSIN